MTLEINQLMLEQFIGKFEFSKNHKCKDKIEGHDVFCIIKCASSQSFEPHQQKWIFIKKAEKQVIFRHSHHFILLDALSVAVPQHLDALSVEGNALDVK